MKTRPTKDNTNSNSEPIDNEKLSREKRTTVNYEMISIANNTSKEGSTPKNIARALDISTVRKLLIKIHDVEDRKLDLKSMCITYQPKANFKRKTERDLRSRLSSSSSPRRPPPPPPHLYRQP